MPTELEKSVSLGTLRVTKERVEELDGFRVLVAVEFRDIAGARAAWTRRSERPVPQLFLAAACAAVGLYSIYGTLLWLLWGGSRHMLIVMCALALPLGIYLGQDAIRRGPVLLLETSRGTRRLTFGAKIERAQVLAFVNEVQRELGYPIEVDSSLK